MRDRSCQLLKAPGDLLVLSRSLPFVQPPEAPGQEALSVLSLSAPLLQPLAIDLRVGLRPLDLPFLDAQPPRQETWFLRSDRPTALQVRPQVQGQGHQERSLAALTASALAEALAEALAQPAPEGLLPTLDSLSIRYVRARLQAPTQSLRVQRGGTLHPVPVEDQWVSGPSEALELPPLALLIQNDDGAIRVRLTIGWSLWLEPPERDAVITFVVALLGAGYCAERIPTALAGRI